LAQCETDTFGEMLVMWNCCKSLL